MLEAPRQASKERRTTSVGARADPLLVWTLCLRASFSHLRIAHRVHVFSLLLIVNRERLSCPARLSARAQGEWEYVGKESRMYEASLGQDSEPSTKQPLYDNNTYNIPGFLGDMQWTLSVIELHFTAS
jgi:hypothetical protein